MGARECRPGTICLSLCWLHMRSCRGGMPTSAILAIAASRDKQVNVAIDHALKVREPRLVQCSNRVRRGSTRGMPVTSSARQKYLTYRTQSLRRRTLLPCARFGPEHAQHIYALKRASLFDHLVGERQYRRRDF
jgi:hypothetical protein